MKDIRPSWVPDRLDWYVGDPRSACDYKIREAHSSDWASIKGVCRSAGRVPTDRTFSRWLSQNIYTVNVAVRNLRHVIALCVSRHRPDKSTILVCHVCEPWRGLPVEGMLTLLAALELPERPLTWSFAPSEDEARAPRLRALGWTFDGSDQDEEGSENHSYTLAPYVGGRYRPDGRGDRPNPSPPARDDGS